MENCILQGNLHGLLRTDPIPVRITDCRITDHDSGYGVLNEHEGSYVDARFNWWGAPSGPSGAGPGNGDAVSQFVWYDPWRPGGSPIAESTRLFPTEWNNARRIARSDIPPHYKVVYPHEMSIFITMSDDPQQGDWTAPLDVWPVEMIHHSTDPAIAVEKTDPDQVRTPLVHLVWAEHLADLPNVPGEIYHCFSEDGGWTWSVPENLSNSIAASEHPSVAVDGDNVVHVVWEEWETASPDIFYVNNAAGTWTSPENISQTPRESSFPTIAANYLYDYPTLPPQEPDDRVHIAWMEFDPPPQGLESPWIAYRSYDLSYGWIPALDEPAEDASAGMGGAHPSIIAFPSLLEAGRIPAVSWHWPYDPEEPPSIGSEIYFNDRTTGAWGVPRMIDTHLPDDRPSRYVSLAPQAGPTPDTLWAVWEEWDLDNGVSEIYSASSPDLGQGWHFHLNLSQTVAVPSLRPSLAYSEASAFEGLYDVCWTEAEVGHRQPASQIYYIGATSAGDTVATTIPDDGKEGIGRVFVRSFPVPFSNTVRFAVTCPYEGGITLRIRDLQGRSVATLSQPSKESDTRWIEWDGTDDRGHMLPAGIYFVRVEIGAVHTNAKVTLLR